MKVRMIFVVIAAMFASMFSPVIAEQAADSSTPEPMMHGDHAMATPGEGQMSMAAFFFTVKNNGDHDDTLLSVDSKVAQTVEVHHTTVVDGVMKMSPLPDGAVIPAGEELVLKPGSYHIMLIGINKSLPEGEKFHATLHFENAGDVKLEVEAFAAEPDFEKNPQEPITVGDLEITNVWARQAPKLDGDGGGMHHGDMDMATPASEDDED